jgi:excisionase family DNA binding protein
MIHDLKPYPADKDSGVPFLEHETIVVKMYRGGYNNDETEVRKIEQALTVDEVALRLNVERKTVYRMLRRGELRDVRAGRLWRAPIAAFQSYVKGRSEMDDEPLSPDDLAAITEGIEAIRHGDFIASV